MKQILYTILLALSIVGIAHANEYSDDYGNLEWVGDNCPHYHALIDQSIIDWLENGMPMKVADAIVDLCYDGAVGPDASYLLKKSYQYSESDRQWQAAYDCYLEARKSYVNQKPQRSSI